MGSYLFKLKEAIPRNYRSAIPREFRINPNTYSDILFIRLLSASADLFNQKTNVLVKTKKNFSSFPYQIVTRKSSKQIKSFLNPYKIDDYIKYSQKYSARNRIFFDNLLQELAFFLYYSNKDQHQAAFVNLYRILEYISYSFPLIHSLKCHNFYGSFNSLRSYFNNEKTSELKFFEKFIENLFDGTTFLDITTRFDFSCSDMVIAENCFKILYNLLGNNIWITVDQNNMLLELENKKLISLFINLRNRYFHFAIGGQRNIQNTDLKDPDFFFERVNDQFLNWIGFIYSTIIKETLESIFI